MSTLSITVPGTAVPQGSMRLVQGGSRMIHSNKNLNGWRATVARHTIAEIQQTERRFGRTFPLTGPVNLIVVFTFPRPKHHYRQGKFSNLLRDVAPRYMQTGPDLDKLVRAIGDALVAACAIVDDKQINVIHAGKKWADGDPQTSIELWSVADDFVIRTHEAEARLAEVLALCNDGRLPSCGLADRDYDGCYVQDVVQKIRAAAQGETAQHYDTEDAHGNPVCVCPDINGEYDAPRWPSTHRTEPADGD